MTPHSFLYPAVELAIRTGVHSGQKPIDAPPVAGYAWRRTILDRSPTSEFGTHSIEYHYVLFAKTKDSQDEYISGGKRQDQTEGSKYSKVPVAKMYDTQ